MAGHTGLDWRLSGAGSLNGASSPAASLGAFRSSDTLYEFESTVTTVQTAQSRRIVRDSARSGDAINLHRGKYLVAVTGSNADLFYASRIIAFEVNGGDGVYTLEEAAPANFGVTDDYRVTDAGNIFEDVTAAEARAGLETFKIIYLYNATGGNLTGLRFYLVPLNPSGSQVQFLVSTGNDENLLTMPDRTTDPRDQWGKVDPDAGSEFNDDNPMSGPVTSASASPSIGRTVNNGTSIALILRREILAGTVKRKSSSFLLIAEEGSLVSAQPFIWNVDGNPSTLSLQNDRDVFISGGCRLKATALDDLGNTQEDRSTFFDVLVGGGTIVNQSGDHQTDSDGEVSVTYRSPSVGVTDGDPLTFQAAIGGGDEV